MDSDSLRTQALVIGSGAGGSVTALELARAGMEVLILEEGAHLERRILEPSSAEALRQLYRRQGMTPLQGRVPLGYLEGRCVGGSTEVNSGFWHRTPAEVLEHWRTTFDLQSAAPHDLLHHFEWVEERLGVSYHSPPLPPGSLVFARGARLSGWPVEEVPRAALHCQNSNRCPSGCPTGAKQGVASRLIPEAQRFGARLLPEHRVERLLVRGRRVIGALVERTGHRGLPEKLRVFADQVFVCAGPTETPALLRRSGIFHRIGDSLSVHPMLKVAARFEERLDAHRSVMPLFQVKASSPDRSLGGAYFTPGHLAMLLSENWPDSHMLMPLFRHMAMYYVAVRGTGIGSVRPSRLEARGTTLRYALSPKDVQALSLGLAQLSELLLRAGAIEVVPAVYGVSPIRSLEQARRWAQTRLPSAALSLGTVHAFSSCPIGEKRQITAADSFGRIRSYLNLYINDASMLPDSPGVNPQGSIMAIARRNVHHFLEAR